MARVIRKQLDPEPGQDRLLKRMARNRGPGGAEMPGASELWEREVAFMRERARVLRRRERSRDWTRAELYEQRLRHYDRTSG